MLALYTVLTVAAAGVVGAFARLALFETGYISGFGSGLAVVGGAACIYVALQFFWVSLLQLLWPTRGRKYLLVECVSHAAVAALAPHLLHVQIEWPHPMFEKAAVFVFLGAFLAIHVALKLVTFYAVLRSDAGSRVESLMWAAAGCLCVGGAYLGATAWLDDLGSSRPHAKETTAPYRSGSVYAEAREMPEGCLYDCGLTARTGDCIVLRWANAPESAGGRLTSAYVTVELMGNTTKRVAGFQEIPKSGWGTQQIPWDDIPTGLRACSITWHVDEEPSWRAITGLRPVSATGRALLLAGPRVCPARGEDGPPTIIVASVDGLGASRLSAMGYDRKTTPSLDRLAFAGRLFSAAYTPYPDATAANATLLTGLNPLRHGLSGASRTPMQETVETLAEILRVQGYTTAAFTEGERYGDLVFGTGLEQGFEVFDVGYTDPGEPDESEEQQEAPKAVGSDLTLARVRAWLAAQGNIPAFVFVRLSDLADGRLHTRYEDAFIPEDTPPTPSDIYDTALAHLDHRLGALVKHARDAVGRDSLCFVVTSPFGMNISGERQARGLDEETLHVPLIMSSTDLGQARHTDPVGLQGVAPTLAALGDGIFTTAIDGTNLRLGLVKRDVISMYGTPLKFTLRADRWRFYWEPGRGGEARVRLYDMERGSRQREVSDRYPDVVERFSTTLSRYASQAPGS